MSAGQRLDPRATSVNKVNSRNRDTYHEEGRVCKLWLKTPLRCTYTQKGGRVLFVSPKAHYSMGCGTALCNKEVI